jgi:hypothetical protein
MSVERDIRFDLIARLCPNTTGAELRSVATEVCTRSCPLVVFITNCIFILQGWHVRHSCTAEGGFGTRFLGCC